MSWDLINNVGLANVPVVADPTAERGSSVQEFKKAKGPSEGMMTNLIQGCSKKLPSTLCPMLVLLVVHFHSRLRTTHFFSSYKDICFCIKFKIERVGRDMHDGTGDGGAVAVACSSVPSTVKPVVVPVLFPAHAGHPVGKPASYEWIARSWGQSGRPNFQFNFCFSELLRRVSAGHSHSLVRARALGYFVFSVSCSF